MEQALINAHQAGDMDAARRLAVAVKAERERRANPIYQVPEMKETLEGPVPSTVPEPRGPSMQERITGAQEAALATGTAMTGGAVGTFAGMVKGLAQELRSGEFGTHEAARRIEESAAEMAQRYTRAPRTEEGQRYVEAIGDVAEQFEPLAPFAPQIGIAAKAARAMPKKIPDVPKAVKGIVMPDAVSKRVQSVLGPDVVPGMRGGGPIVRDQTPSVREGEQPGQYRDAEELERMSQSLPVPVKLTKGDVTGDFEQQRFEAETAKLPDIGKPIREFRADQREQVVQNIDAFIDKTRGSAKDLYGIGLSVDDALQRQINKQKEKIRTLYKAAEKSGEMESPIDTKSVVDWLNESYPAESTAPVISAARKELIRLGGARVADDGMLVPSQTGLPLKHMEQLRQFINQNAGNEGANLRYAIDAKRVIDGSTEGFGGDKYLAARKARAELGAEYENRALVKALTSTKPGTADHAVAMEKVLDRAVLSRSTSYDDLAHLKKLLLVRGEGGKQAWRDLRAGTLNHIKSAVTKSATLDERGNTVVSPAALNKVISDLDSSGKLDLLLGKKMASDLRTLNEVSKIALTSVPGAVNYSNTATVLAGLVDVMISGTSGVPAPVMTVYKQAAKAITDAKLRRQVQEALGE